MRHILNAIRRMRFGVITLIIQDGIVIQIDQTEKTRLDYSQSLEQEGSGI
ncbi:MAG TPA: YezD family protein [Armatimonadota bacterium]|nr:YezD family protein [Armatimonadota bacterium]